MKKNQIVEAVSNNVVDYFANSIASSDFVENYIRCIIPVSDEQESKITDILSEYNRDWNNADCDAEGATQEQDLQLDLIIEKCGKEIMNLLLTK